MPTLRHTCTLEPIPRRRLEEAVLAMHGILAETRSENGVLFLEEQAIPYVEHTGGRHLAPGARYTIDERESEQDAAVAEGPDLREEYPLLLEVAEWSRTGPTRLRLTGADPQVDAHGELVLHTAHRPDLLTATATFRGVGSFARYRRAELRAKLDLTRWYDGRTSPAPLNAGVRHPLLRGAVRATVKHQKDGRWQVTVTTAFRGRSWARPVVAAAWLFSRSRVREWYRGALDEMAEDWNAEVPRLVEEPQGNLRAEALAALRARD